MHVATSSPRTRPVRTFAVLALLTAVAVLAVAIAQHLSTGALPPDVHVPRPAVVTAPAPDVPWPAEGQAAYALDGVVHVSPHESPQPIASLAKLMTAWVVVHDLPQDEVLRVTGADVADTARRSARGESVVPVAVGEQLTRSEALEALLLPSANNVAAMLATRTAGSQAEFVRRMNDAARQLGMRATTYTDPSGYDAGTVSTAADQLRLAAAVFADPVLGPVTGLPSAVLPVAGPVSSTDALLGVDGFVAGKTGSTAAAGGCFAFRAQRGGRVLTGVVLGQRDGPLIGAGLAAAQRLAAAAWS